LPRQGGCEKASATRWNQGRHISQFALAPPLIEQDIQSRGFLAQATAKES